MYFIALTLQGKTSEYEPLYNALKALGPWSNRLPSTWLVESRLSARRIRDLLKPHLKSADRLFVGQFSRNWAGTGMGAGFPDWMTRRSFEIEAKDATKPQQGQDT
jgi:hypothetical protein